MRARRPCPASPRAPRRGRGFTLIELLVVIAIISLLMTILLPALSSTRRTARTTMCLTNLHGIGQAMLTYAEDHAEQFPTWSTYHVFGGNGTSGDAPGPAWTEQLLEKGHLETPKVYFDPARPRDSATFSYFMQTRFIFVRTGQVGASLPARLVHFTGAFVLGGDGNSRTLYPQPYGTDPRPHPDCDQDDASRPLVFFDDPPPAPQYPFAEAELNPHGGNRANLLFIDGHAATFTGFSRTDMTWHATKMTDWLLR
jgi:prepilin-type N-terminal cleavage/methylation domain-containing protein/prepilin-type processing-associated H-X9-DG protein